MNNYRRLIVCLLCLTGSSSVLAFQTDPPTNATFAVVGARVFDGKTSLEDTTVLVVDGVIAGLGQQLAVPEDVRIIQADGHTLLPGFIDSHTHAYFGNQLQQAAMFGVTTELDMMSMPTVAANFRREQEDGKAIGRADLFSAGAAVTVKGGHGTQFGFKVPTLDSADQADAFVRARIREGSDYIKIIYEDGRAFGMNRPTLSPKMLKASIDATHAQDKLAVCHIGGFDQAAQAVEFGTDGLVHLFADKEVTEEFIKMAVEKKLFVVPTAAVVSNASGSPSANLIANNKRLALMLNNENLANLQRTFPVREGSLNSWDTLKNNIRKLHEAGVPILAGTDAPNPGTIHGASMMHEILLLTQAGLSNQAAIQAATANPAEQFGLKDRGRIVKGLRADFLLVKGNPIESIEDIRNIQRVWKSGVEIDLEPRLLQVARERGSATEGENELADADRLISNFDDGELRAEFGAGWSDSTDAMMGGTSTVEKSIVEGGAEDSSHSMKISGNCRDQQPIFAGGMFSPADRPMQPANISAHPAISFWAKGDGKTYDIMLFSQKRGFMPSTKKFKAEDEWKQYTFSISDFDGCTGKDVLGIYFGSGTAGDFEFQIDQIKLLKSDADKD